MKHSCWSVKQRAAPVTGSEFGGRTILEGSPLGTVTVDREDGVWTVSLRGEHDLATVDELRQTLDVVLAPEEIHLTRPALVVVDLSAAAFVHSTVISALARAYLAADGDPDAQLVLVEPPGSFIARIAALVGLQQVIPTYPTRAEAIAALAALGTTPQPHREPA